MVRNALSFPFTLSFVKPGFDVPIAPPNINSNSVSITSSASALPVNTFVPSKNVVVPFVYTFSTSVTNTPAKVALFMPNAFVEYAKPVNTD